LDSAFLSKEGPNGISDLVTGAAGRLVSERVLDKHGA